MSDLRFELAPAVRLVVLDDEAVVFNPFTWETHILNAAATLVLERARCGGCDANEVEQLLAEVLQEDEKAIAAEHALRVLGDLASQRLIVEHGKG